MNSLKKKKWKQVSRSHVDSFMEEVIVNYHIYCCLIHHQSLFLSFPLSVSHRSVPANLKSLLSLDSCQQPNATHSSLQAFQGISQKWKPSCAPPQAPVCWYSPRNSWGLGDFLGSMKFLIQNTMCWGEKLLNKVTKNHWIPIGLATLTILPRPPRWWRAVNPHGGPRDTSAQIVTSNHPGPTVQRSEEDSNPGIIFAKETYGSSSKNRRAVLSLDWSIIPARTPSSVAWHALPQSPNM